MTTPEDKAAELAATAARLQASVGGLIRQVRPATPRGRHQTRAPLDTKPWPRDPRSRVLTAEIPSGIYVYVRDAAGTIHVCPDPKAGHGTHLHPQILGYGQPVSGAGALTIGSDATIERLDNYSGTFKCGSASLPDVLAQAVKQGLKQTATTKLVPWTKHL